MKKAFNFRSALVIVLVLVMCLMAFVACDKDKDGQKDNDNGLSNAKEYVKALYINNSSKTAADYTVVSYVTIAGVKYTVKWSVEITTEGVDASAVKVVAGEENTTIDVIDIAEQDINYTLTATVHDANGKTESVSFNRTVPKFRVNTWAEYAAAKDDELIIADGVVTMYSSKTGGIFTQYGSTTNKGKYNTMYIQNAEGAFYAYSMQKDPATIEGLAVGKTVRISGIKKNYQGTLELTEVAVKEILDDTIKTVEPVDITTLYANAKDAKDTTITNLQGQLVTLKNVVILSGDTGSKYCYFTLNGVKSYVRPSTSTSAFPGDKIEDFCKAFNTNKGHYATITGQVLVYNSVFYIQPLNENAVVFGEMATLTPAEEVQFVKDNADALPDVTNNGATLTLPTQSDLFEGRVKISWTADNTEICKIENGVATFTYDDTKEGGKVKLTATYTHEDTTVEAVTDVFEVKLLTPQEITVEDFLKKSTGNSVYIIKGHVVAVNKVGSAGAFIIADKTGAVLVFEPVLNVTLGEEIKVFGRRAAFNGTPQLYPLSMQKVEGGKAYTYPEPATIDVEKIKSTTFNASNIADYTGKYTKITGATLYLGSDGYMTAGTLKDGSTTEYDKLIAIYANSTIRDAATKDGLVGAPVNIYGYVRGFADKGKSLQVQVVSYELALEDAKCIEAAKEALTIEGTEFSKDFPLPLTGKYGTTIAWSIKETDVTCIKIDGATAKVTAPAEKTNVTLVAKISKGNAQAQTKEFPISILAETPKYTVTWTDEHLTATYGENQTLTSGEKVDKDTEITFTVAVPNGKVVKSVTAGGKAVADVAFAKSFKVAVTADNTAIVVEYDTYTVVNSISEFLAKEANNTLYAITGYIGAIDRVDPDKDNCYSYVLIDESGSVFSYNKIKGFVVGDYVTVYANRTDNAVTKSDKTVVAQFPQLGTKHVEKLEGGTYVEPTAVDLDVNVDGVALDASNLYLGKFYKIVGTTLKLDSKGNFFLYNSANTKLVKAFANDNLTDDIKAMDGKEVVVYAYSRGLYYENYWQVQVVRMLEVNDALKVERAAAALDLASKTFGTGEVKLQATGLYDSKITWKSDNAAILITADGVTATIVAGTTDTSVKLTATIAIGETSTTKEFNVTVTATTPEYTVTFANVTGATVDVQVDGVAIATGAKVEQGKTLTISVTVDTENYVLVAVKAGATTLEAVEGKYTHQVVADVEITVEVKPNKGLSPEKAYSVVEIIEATSGLATDEVTSDILYLKGVVKSFDNMTTYAKNLYLADEKDSTKTFLVYSASFGTKEGSVTSISVGDTVVVAGYVKNYKGTIEMASANSINVQFISRTAGQGSIVIGETGNATVTVDNGQTTGDNGSTFTFEVAVTTGYEIVSVKVNGKTVEAVEGKYTGTISGVTTITVETKVAGAADPVVVATATFGASTNSKSVGGYTTSWEATCNGVTFSIANFNNNNNGWEFIRCGSKKAASVASIATKAAMANAITKVVVTLDSVTVDSVNSIKLLVASDANFNNIVETVDGTVAQGEMTFNVAEANRAANLYYKVVFDCKVGKGNGFVQVSKVEFYGLA